MKIKKLQKKLTLIKETIAHLEDEAMVKVVGGDPHVTLSKCGGHVTLVEACD
ncbi:MAG: hypothetical protein GY940_30910 [bacterium]|nr:hypothetical protein [bacterium]